MLPIKLHVTNTSILILSTQQSRTETNSCLSTLLLGELPHQAIAVPETGFPGFPAQAQVPGFCICHMTCYISPGFNLSSHAAVL